MKIAVVMPRHMSFGPKRATSIDLVVYDIVKNLPPLNGVTIYTEQIECAFPGVDVRMFPRSGVLDKFLFLWRIARQIRHDCPDVIVVQQHVISGVRLARLLPKWPVILHCHAFPPLRSNGFKNFMRLYKYRFFDGIIFVSQACLKRYVMLWRSQTRVPGYVVSNGVMLSEWAPSVDREKMILCVGRLAPEKGVVLCVHAVRNILKANPNWRAHFILTGVDVHPDYRDQFFDSISDIKDRVIVQTNQPWSEIKAAYERAAIAVVPSIWDEPFGRTALEAMAGGSALISSTRGGLDEVVGDAAVRLTDFTPDTIAAALTDLIDHPEKRAALSARGLVQAKKFTIEAQVEAFLSACRAAIDHRKKGEAGK